MWRGTRAQAAHRPAITYCGLHGVELQAERHRPMLEGCGGASWVAHRGHDAGRGTSGSATCACLRWSAR
eukprot:scaffold13653_cov109-Isochrysis_galbana.AAC.3